VFVATDPGAGAGQKSARRCWRLEPTAAIFGAGFNDAEGVAPRVAGVEGSLGPRLACDAAAGFVRDGAGVDHALTNSFERLVRAQVDVTGVGSREGWVPVGDRIPAGQQNTIAIEVVASGGDTLAWARAREKPGWRDMARLVGSWISISAENALRASGVGRAPI